MLRDTREQKQPGAGAGERRSDLLRSPGTRDLQQLVLLSVERK